jgi:dihydropteroate synthase
MATCTLDVVVPPEAARLPADAAAWARVSQAVVVRLRPRSEQAAHALHHLCEPEEASPTWRCAHQDGAWLLMGALAELEALAGRWAASPGPHMAALGRELAQALRRAATPLGGSAQIGARTFRWGQRTYVMGIVNVTSDSFSGDGLYSEGQATADAWTSRAVEQALAFVAQGADIIDVGGESTRPGATPVDAEEELRRVIPAIAAIRRQSDIPISVDTFKARVAQAALDAGADLINDVWGLRLDPEMGPLTAARGVPVILMHNRSQPKEAALTERLGGRYVGVAYDDLTLDLLEELQGQVEQAVAWGISRERIIVDPGLGFGKTVEQNLALVNRCRALRVLGLPILLGPSRKSFIGYTLDLPPEQRAHGTMASLAVAIARGGVDLVRVHDVVAAVQSARMADAIVRGKASCTGEQR